MTLRDKVCVVTGASSGIGRRTASDLAAEGARVCVVARRQERLEEVVGALAGSGHSFVTADVTDRDQVADLAEHVRATYGRCDVLVNNAGFSRGRAFRGEASIEDVEAVMKTNFFGVVYVTAALLPLLQASPPSHVVNVASIAGRIAFGNASAYCASKFAVVGWTEAVRFDLERSGVHVSSVEPGPIPTEGFDQKALTRHPVLRHATGTEADVSAAIQDAILHRRAVRSVPRWYYLAQFPRLFAPRLHRYVVGKVVSRRVPEDR